MLETEWDTEKAKHPRHYKPTMLCNMEGVDTWAVKHFACFLAGYSMLLVDDPLSYYKEAPRVARALRALAFAGAIQVADTQKGPSSTQYWHKIFR